FRIEGQVLPERRDGKSNDAVKFGAKFLRLHVFTAVEMSHSHFALARCEFEVDQSATTAVCSTILSRSAKVFVTTNICSVSQAGRSDTNGGTSPVCAMPAN